MRTFLNWMADGLRSKQGTVKMPYVYTNLDALDYSDKVGSHQCVALIQTYTHAPATSAWKEGQRVNDASSIVKGTAIATFVAGRYPNKSRSNHAAFFVAKGAGGIWILDQWADDKTKPKVSKRFIKNKGKNKVGAYLDPSNNADAYSIIE